MRLSVLGLVVRLSLVSCVACTGLVESTPKSDDVMPRLDPGVSGDPSSPSHSTPPSSSSSPATDPPAPTSDLHYVDGEVRNHLSGVYPGVSILVTDLVFPTMLAVDDTRLYFGSRADYGSLMDAPKTGGAARTLAVGEFGDRILVDDARIFWGNGDHLNDTQHDGTGTEVLGTFGVQGFVQDAASIFSVTTNGGINVTSKATGATSHLTTLVGVPDTSRGIALDADRIYFVHGSSISSMPREGGATTALVTGRAGLVTSEPSIAIDETTLYWTEFNDGASSGVYSVPLAGGPVTTLATGRLGATGLVASAGTLYWMDVNAAAVVKMPTTGGTPSVVAANQPWPVSIAVDATSIYWLNFGSTTGGSIPGHMKGQIARKSK